MEQLTYEQKQQAARAKRDQQEAEVKALFPELVKQIAAAMGYTARFTGKNGEPFYRCTAVIEQGTRCISLNTSDYSPDFRLSISGDYDMGPSELSIGWPYGLARPSITVSMRRSAAAIAKEINSRFLPDYDAACTKIAEKIKQATDHRDSVRSTCDRLAAVAGAEVRKVHGSDEKQTEFFKYYGKEPYTGPHLEVKASNGTATITFDCGVDLAAAIVKAIDSLAPLANPNDYSVQRCRWEHHDEAGECTGVTTKEAPTPLDQLPIHDPTGPIPIPPRKAESKAIRKG